MKYTVKVELNSHLGTMFQTYTDCYFKPGDSILYKMVKGTEYPITEACSNLGDDETVTIVSIHPTNNLPEQSKVDVILERMEKNLFELNKLLKP